jgi:hypothetical protein
MVKASFTKVEEDSSTATLLTVLTAMEVNRARSLALFESLT